MTTPLALQLYTLREALAQDFKGTMRAVAEIGFLGVETAFWPPHISLAEAAQTMRDMGIDVCAAHTEIPLDDQREAVLKVAEVFECEQVIWHGWPQPDDYDSLDGIKRLAERYNQANEVARSNGLSFGLHNHWWEFEPVEGRYPYQLLLELLEPTVFFELDAYWAKTAGVDPVQAIGDIGNRLQLLHLKDGPAKKDQPMTALGQGTLDIPAIVLAGASATWLIVELDEVATDMLTAVRTSYHYMTQNGYAVGKI